MKLTLVSIDREGVIHIAAEGQITSLDFVQQSNRNPLEMLMGLEWSKQRVMLNLDKVSYVDSTAIGWLVACYKRFKENGGMMVLHSIHPSVSQVFEMLKIGSLFPLVSDEAAARAALAGNKTGAKP